MQVVNYQGNPEGPAESEQAPQTETPETPVDAGEVLNHAQNTTSNLDSQVATEENRGLLQPSEPLSFGSEVSSGNIDTSGFNLDEVELSESAPAAVGNGPRDEYSMGERVSSPEEMALLSRLADGEIGFDDPDVVALAEELGMEEVLRTAHIDALEPGEVPEEIIESTPEMLEGSKNEVQAEIDGIQAQIDSLPAGSPEIQGLERRAGFLTGFIDSIESILNGEQPGGGFDGINPTGDKDVLNNAMRHMGIDENTGQADKFLMGIARDANETPWCAGFVSYVLKESGYDITPTLSSKAFIGETGKGHVAFYAGNNQMLGGNQADKVSIAPIRKPIKGWITPEDLEAGRPPVRGGTPPIGAIIVFDRGSADRNMR